jgi:hypothetical protein
VSNPDGKLSDLVSLMSHPPRLRRGNTWLTTFPNQTAGQPLSYPISNTYWERIVAVSAVLVTSSTAGYRQVQANYLSGDGGIIDQSQCSGLIGPSTTWSIYGDLTGSPAIGAGASPQVQGQVTSPAALTAIASETLPQGSYEVTWQVGLSGTTGASDADNFGLYVGSTLVATSENETTAGGQWPQDPQIVNVPAGGAAVRIRSIAAGTTGAVYAAELTATQQSNLTSYPQLPDLVLQSGWSFQLLADNMQTGDLFSPVLVMSERYPSDYASGTLAYDHREELRQLAAELIGQE